MEDKNQETFKVNEFLTFKGRLYQIQDGREYGLYIFYENIGISLEKALKIGFKKEKTLFDGVPLGGDL